jgi:iron-sulfur cluster assembly protein
MITITKRAIPQLKYILGNNKAIFFGAKSGGCNGFEYILKPIHKIEYKKMDNLITISELPFVLCSQTQFLFIGTQIDWKEDYMGKRFDFTNPLSSGVCGCGSTFSVS